MGLVIKARSRRSVRYWAKHLTNTAENERVEIVEKHALMRESVGGMLREMRDYGRLARRCQNFLHIASFNPETHEPLTEDQWQQMYEIYERQRGIPPDQPRFVVEHEKKGRIHRHVVWLRLDLATLLAFPDGFPLQVCLAAQTKIEDKLGLTPGQHRVKFGAKIKPWERMRGERSGIDPHEVTAEITSLFRQSKNGPEFIDALHRHGYSSLHGNRAFCVLDRAGDVHSLVKRIEGINTRELKEFLKDVNLSGMPTVEQSRTKRRERKQREKGREGDKQPVRNRKRAHPACGQAISIISIEPTRQPASGQPDQQQSIGSGPPCGHPITEVPSHPRPNITTAPIPSPHLADEKATEPSATDQLKSQHQQQSQENTRAVLPDQRPNPHTGKHNEATGPPLRRFPPGAIKQLWKAAKQALTEPAPTPEPKPRRREESATGLFKRAALVLWPRGHPQRLFKQARTLAHRAILSIFHPAQFVWDNSAAPAQMPGELYCGQHLQQVHHAPPDDAAGASRQQEQHSTNHLFPQP